ncbi:sterile alpha motif domain-containing protein 9-like [Melanotaenia boesemani]|uniref:sterile alpha motif domain-containing protein 9-like n=1 Tax=Melanotaenia boesemani TaxID=1250792 RepID=UPI001C0553D8|nr:sterile alpha motif domain-containing protein 9-like [Melanotaenia boesemani]XP_041856699.1 sterile alpha motif domain-containing protein 9-like [Melanotaenia boesemani]XP_041856700.1 sterile alpha motif domain-containing protein 9-like [Melanotaenia boesemani]
MADHGELEEGDLPPDIKDWNNHQVREWALKLELGVESSVADILFRQDINGPSLLLLDTTDLNNMGVTFGPAKLLLHARDEKLKREELTDPTMQPGKPCKPYPFCRYHDTFSYVESSILDVTESGASDFIEPCHEYKAFINTPDEAKLLKFTTEVIRFAAACMNSRTNGTIHFGIGDRPDFIHGQVLGVVFEDKESYGKELKSAIDSCFDKHKSAAQMCIKPPRFVEVLNKNTTSSDKSVIEVDIVPESTICEENIYNTYNTKKGKKKAKDTESQPSKCFYVRDGGSSRDLLASTKPMEEFNKFVDSMSHLSQLRKNAEEKHLTVIKRSTQGSRLSQMITGGTLSLDKSHFERYVIVTNKSHPSHFECLGFLIELNPTAVLDFDPKSAEHGLQNYFDQQSTVNLHLPANYKITEGVEDIAKKLKLTRNTSWVFCNGGTEHEEPSETNQWLMEKGASVRDVISFLCRKDVLPNKRFLVIFLLFSAVRERMDPLVETFSTFLQELRGTEQILCIFENEKAFTCWRGLIEARCGINISGRCIYELSFSEVNGTILSLWSKNRRAIRFLPCGGGAKVPLEKKVERSLSTLEVLCVNQCDGGNEDRIAIEENFYKGGKVSWWNFYFSEQPGSTPFIKRDMFDYIMDTVIPDLCSLRKACVLINLRHVPGCGGTTLAMHVLWALRHRFRCTVLKNSNSDFVEVAEQVVTLLMHYHEEQTPKIPVLLMIDDFDDLEKVHDLMQLIEKECAQKDIQSKSAQVILLNCMRSESSEVTEPTADTVFIGNDLSEKEQKMFEEKLVEIEKTHRNAETFYGFMIMKKNFKSEYIQGVVRNTLKSFHMNQKHAQLLAVLVLLNVYCKSSSLSVSLCEDFLDLHPKPVCGKIKVEDGFGKFSNFIASCSVEGKVVFQAVKIIHSSIARQCLQELTTTHNVTKAEISDLLLTTDQLYESTQGKGNLLQDVHHILVRRIFSKEESQFSPLIQDIATETPGLEEKVLNSASKRFKKDAIIFQLLARYYYLKKKDFSEAKFWAEKAKELSRDSSYIADTSAQVLKHELKHAIANCTPESVNPENIEKFLKMVQSALDAFRQAQTLAKKESLQRLNVKTDNCPFNTSGCLGEVQVGVLVIEVLRKTPVFTDDTVRHDIMSQVLSGDVKLEQVERNDPRRNKNRNYYVLLKKFEDLLSSLKYRMKLNIDFLDNLYVNLGTRFGMKDSREQVAQNELVRCFRQYAVVFCRTASRFKSEELNIKMTLFQKRQFLENNKADTYSGILNYLSEDNSAAMMEKIVRCYQFVCGQQKPDAKERINFIYANVVLSCIKLESQCVLPYQKLLDLLNQVLREQYSLRDCLPLMFITVVLLWPQLQSQKDMNLGRYISQMKTSYHEAMKEVYNGKSPIVHFLLGKKRGYERLVHVEEIKKCIMVGQEDFSSRWGNGKIWKDKNVKELLWRVTGEVKNKTGRTGIMAETCFSDLKVEVAPMYRSQISGYAEGSKVSFFVGFSMKGPLALDIELER